MKSAILLTACAVAVSAKTSHRRLRNRDIVLEVHQTTSEQHESQPSLLENEQIDSEMDEFIRYLEVSEMSLPSPTLSPTANSVPSPTLSPTANPLPSPTLSPTVSPPVSTLPPISPTTSSPTEESSEYRALQIAEKCGVTPLERSRDIFSILSVISEPMDLVTPSTPQFMARDWLDAVDDAIICANAPERVAQRYRFALMYYGMGGPTWHNCRALEDADSTSLCVESEIRNSDNRRLADTQEVVAVEYSVRWLDESNECAWFGIDCGSDFDDNGEYEADVYFPAQVIDLLSNNLTGSLLDEIFDFEDLSSLYLDGNLNIMGTIPTSIGNLNKLEYLSLKDNQLTGTIPDTLFDLTSLVSLDLGANSLEGPVTDSIGSLILLTVLRLEENHFVGEVPIKGLYDMENLAALTIQDNLFTGSLEELCAVVDERRAENPMYLMFMYAECSGSDPMVTCSCCTCV
eukprot:Nitzschia sp. Nitz4//scaffold249_size28687//7235//8690//NITZ4_008116-RA/size28687-snap-gene-0.2-mRNA-1//1//CDS//3329544014//3043//frame0